jgi:hypothetical protein
LGAVLEEGAKAVGVAEAEAEAGAEEWARAEAGAEVLCSIPIANQGGVTFERVPQVGGDIKIVGPDRLLLDTLRPRARLAILSDAVHLERRRPWVRPANQAPATNRKRPKPCEPD